MRRPKSEGLPSGSAIFIRLNYNHFDGDWGAKQVNHLLVSEGSNGHLADLHQSAALSQSCLPGETKGLHVGYDALEIDVEAELAEAIPAKCHLRGFAPSGGDLEAEWKRPFL